MSEGPGVISEVPKRIALGSDLVQDETRARGKSVLLRKEVGFEGL